MGKNGVCSLCLDTGPLSFEHVPPRRVFNSRPAVAHTIYGLHVGSKYERAPVLLKGPRGLGIHSLCQSCNGKTADWYGDAFAEWTTQCLCYAERLRGTNTVLLPFTIRPLNVLKQIATMAIAVSGCRESDPQIDPLRRFVLSPNAMYVPDRVTFRSYFNPVDRARSGEPILTQNRLSGSCAVLDVRSRSSVFVLAEVAFPPRGYVCYFAEPHERVSDDFATLCDVTGFGRYPRGRKVTLMFQMPVRYPFGPVPGYYPNLNDPRQRQFVDDDHVLLDSSGAGRT